MDVAHKQVRPAFDQQNSAPAGDALVRVERARSLADLIAGIRCHNRGFDPDRMQTIAILGAGPEGQRLAGLCRARGTAIATVVDDDAGKVGEIVHGLKVESTGALQKLDRHMPIVIASHRALDPTRRLRALGFATVLPFAALQALAPAQFKPHMFYDGWLQDLLENRDQYRWLERELADDRSREVLDAVLQYRLTADPEMLGPVIDKGAHHNGLYHPTGLFDLGSDEVYVDAGAFDGDSIRWFTGRVADRYQRILAFEPDPQTYARLRANFAGEKRIETINAGLHREKAVLRFRDDASRGAIFTDEGASSIEVVSLDDVLDGDRASYIKMNIEGAEIDAIAGARKTIQRWLPKLALSVYHRPSDLWHIPQLVRELSPQYQLFLRQHDGGVIETVLYAVPRTNAVA